MNKHSLTQLEMLLLQCRAKAGTKAVVLCGSYSGATRYVAAIAERMQEGEVIAWFQGVLEFPNGSVLRVSVTK